MLFEAEVMLKEFIRRSFLPNNISINFHSMFYKNLESLNNNLLLNDLKKLYTDTNSLNSFEKNCNVIIINSKNDLILDQDSSDDFIALLKLYLTVSFHILFFIFIIQISFDDMVKI